MGERSEVVFRVERAEGRKVKGEQQGFPNHTQKGDLTEGSLRKNKRWGGQEKGYKLV